MSVKGSFAVKIDKSDNVNIVISVNDSKVTVINHQDRPTYKVKWKGGKSESDHFAHHLGKVDKNGLKNNKKIKFKVFVWCKKKRRLFTRYRRLSPCTFLIKSKS